MKTENYVRQNRGASYAKAPVITFLDSHVECTEGKMFQN